MIPRDGSIFHIAGDDEAIRDEETSKIISELEKKSVGLQLLIETPPRISPVVTKSTMGHSRDESCTDSTFMKFCCLCHKKLKLKMDVFMYREQAFCSLGCREQKITIDKRNELEISMIAPQGHHHYHRLRESNVGALTRRKGRLLVT